MATQRHSSKKTKLRSAVGGDSVTEATGDLLGLLPVVDQSAIKSALEPLCLEYIENRFTRMVIVWGTTNKMLKFAIVFPRALD